MDQKGGKLIWAGGNGRGSASSGNAAFHLLNPEMVETIRQWGFGIAQNVCSSISRLVSSLPVHMPDY